MRYLFSLLFGEVCFVVVGFFLGFFFFLNTPEVCMLANVGPFPISVFE